MLPSIDPKKKKKNASKSKSKSRASSVVKKPDDLTTAQKLQYAVNFFDSIVPNQTGFSSSVAAVTIVPDVHLISDAWKKWFIARTQLERLNFIRQRIKYVKMVKEQQERQQKENLGDVEMGMNENGEEVIEFSLDTDQQRNGDLSEPNPPTGYKPRLLSTVKDQSSSFSDQPSSATTFGKRTAVQIHTGSRDQVAVHAQLQDETNLESYLTTDEIEQLTVYCRDYARSSANCDPYGCDEFVVRRTTDLDTLLDLEEDAEDRVRQANEELRLARTIVHQGSLHPSSHLTQEQDPDINETSEVFTSITKGHSIRLSTDGISNLPSGYRRLQHQQGNRKLNTFDDNWDEVDRMVASQRDHNKKKNVSDNKQASSGTSKDTLMTGVWSCPCVRPSRDADLESDSDDRDERDNSMRSAKLFQKVTGQIIDVDSYAVVTFTSRQAAVAARQCVADGSGLDRWRQLDDIPTPPLADAPPFNTCDFRGYCRPVTFTLPTEQKRWRETIAITAVILFCLTYTIPLTAVSTALSDERTLPGLRKILPNAAGLISGLLRTALLSICPQIFKFLSNFGSGATSVRGAEYKALQYYWIFTLATSFTGTALATTYFEASNSGFQFGERTKQLLIIVAETIPTTVGATWLNWIILRFTFTLPVNYLLQFNNFLFRCLNLKCFARLTAGGGPGGPMPYRVYVDSSAVLLCIFCLAPVCPLIAPAAMAYFLVADPMFRFLHIFTYRPMFDGGGLRWAMIHNQMISAMILSQVLLATMMALKKGFVMAILAALSIIPTEAFHRATIDRFLGPYQDAALLQTAELDGWSREDVMTMEEREGFRRWLVDAHKASYVPVCVLTTGDDIESTAEPAVTVPKENDPAIGDHQSSDGSHLTRNHPSTEQELQTSPNNQRGALFRRVTSNRSFPVSSNMSHPEEVDSSRNASQPSTTSSRRLGLSAVRNSPFSASVLFQGASRRPDNLSSFKKV